MKKITLICVVVLAAGWIVRPARDADAQRRYSWGRRSQPADLIRRIANLELRVAGLEQALNRKAPPAVGVGHVVSVEEAEQSAANAKERLRFSRDRFRKGFISEAEMAEHNFAAKRAETVLRLAQAVRDGQPQKPLENELEILEAEHFLGQAKRQLKYARGVTALGFDAQLEAHREALR